MKKILHPKLIEGRIRDGDFGSDDSYGLEGAFQITGPTPIMQTLRIMCGIGEGWEHVSVSLKNRCPNWSEMCFVKDLFWNEDECVVQFHPPKSEYVNCHPFCLHLWKPIDVNIATPPTLLVGPRGTADVGS